MALATKPLKEDLPVIEIGVERLPQLFHTLDPYPFKERDLDRDVEEYIVDWARELPRHQPLKILVHLPQAEAETPAARELESALQHYFAYRGEVIRRDLNELFRIGRRSLIVGLAVLGLCLAAGNIVGMLGTGYVARFLGEGLIILGWVANWRPIEIFLYDWWPVVRRRNLYRRLAVAAVILKPTPAPRA
ncbi:hypothetical protein [Dongia sp.]|uniref:hypothetical protein n=1 Tax=Dongia sp. TaxID=1977262 RepID=UPI0037526225